MSKISILLSVIWLMLMGNIITSQTIDFYYVRARCTAYSPKEKGESARSHLNKPIRDEIGLATPRNDFPDGTRFFIEGCGERIKDDTIPTRSIRKHKRIAKQKGISIDTVLDIRFYESVTKKDIKKQLKERDMGYMWVRVYENR